MFIDEDIYMEHFGVKGMRWGVRNKSKKAPLTAKEKNKKEMQEWIKGRKSQLK